MQNSHKFSANSPVTSASWEFLMDQSEGSTFAASRPCLCLELESSTCGHERIVTNPKAQTEAAVK